MKKFNKFKVTTFTFLTTFLFNIQNALADTSLEIDTEVISERFTPIQEDILFLLALFCVAFSLFDLLQAYLASRVKDEEEQEQHPFWKIVKTKIYDLILLGIGIIVITAITINV